MNSANYSIIQLTDKTPFYNVSEAINKDFNFQIMPYDRLPSQSSEVIGIILEADELNEQHCELIKSYLSLGNDFNLCVISKTFNAEVIQTLSLLVQVVWFSNEQIDKEYEKVSQQIETFFTKKANFASYCNTVKMRSSSSSQAGSLSMVAHQWRQPINIISMEAINLIVQSSVEDTIDSNIVHEGATLIAEQTQRMSGILKTVLDLGKSNRVKQKFMLNEMLKKIEVYFADELKIHDITLSITYFLEDKYIYGYQTDLEEVLINLITNAKDAYKTVERLSDKEINIKAYNDEDYLMLSIKDDAGGIPEEIREKIFEPSFSTKGKSEGFGIGLHLAKLIIQQEFNGYISLKVHKTGTEFIIKIPRHDIKNLKYINS